MARTYRRHKGGMNRYRKMKSKRRTKRKRITISRGGYHI